MPDPESLDRPPVLTRRQGLLGLLAVVGIGGALTACSSTASDENSAVPTTAASAAVDPTLADEQALIARYDATIAAFPTLAGALGTLRGQHAEHLAALGGADGATPASPQAPAAPTAKAAIGSLIDAEREAMRLRLAACVDATDPERARVLAFIAASEGSHIPALKKVEA